MHRFALLVCVACLVGSLATRTRGQDALGVAGTLDDPGGRVGAAVRAALTRAAGGGASARLTFWGASHTASDQYTSVIRRMLRARYGDGGSGLVMPAMPFPLYEMRDFSVPERPPFSGRFLRGRDHTRGVYGRAGFAIDVDAEATATLTPTSSLRIAHAELWAMAQTGGGSVALRVNDREVASVDTSRGEAGSLVRAVADVTPGAHTLTVAARGDGPVRIFGVLSESDRPGVIVEAFGVPGARARDQHPWDEAAFAEQVRARMPDLLTIAYGTNESGDGTALDDVEASVTTTIERVLRAAPGAACLVIGPSDRPRLRGSEYVARPRSTELASRFHRVATAHGCAFFDMLAWQGGAGSVGRWVEAGLALPDHVHLTDEGHERLGRAILAGLGF